MGLKLTPPPSSTDNDRRRFDRMVYDALRELDKRPSAAGASSDASARTLIAALASRVAALEASGGAADIPPTMLTASETIAKYNVVTADGDRADSGTAAHAGKIAGIALGDADADADFEVAPSGRTVIDAEWTWTPGQIFWAGTDGALATVPGSEAFQQAVAVAISATEILVLIGDPVLSPATGPFVTRDASGILKGSAAGFSTYGLSLGAAADDAAARAVLALTSAATGDAAGLTSGTLDPARLPYLPNGTYVYSDSDVAGLSVGQQADVTAGGAGTVVVTTDGELWSYTGSGSVTDEASYVLLSLSPLWGSIGGTLADQTDLQDALDLKLEDAPSDGEQYARMDGDWTIVTAVSKTITTSEALSEGNFVNVWNDSGTPKVRKADATAAGMEAIGFVLADSASGADAIVYFWGTNTQLTGLTTGARYYLDTTPGAVADTPPTGTGNVVQYVGAAISETEISFERSEGIILA